MEAANEDFQPKWVFSIQIIGMDKEGEIGLRYKCLLEDIEDRLAYLERQWRQYFLGIQSLTSVLLLTEPALDLTSLQEELIFQDADEL